MSTVENETRLIARSQIGGTTIMKVLAWCYNCGVQKALILESDLWGTAAKCLSCGGYTDGIQVKPVATKWLRDLLGK